MSHEFTPFPPLPNGLVIHAQLDPMFDRMQMQSYALKMADAATLRQQAARGDEDTIALEAARDIAAMTARNHAQHVAKIQVRVRAALEAALSAQPAPSSKEAGFVQHIELLDREVDSLRGVIATYEAAASGSDGVWFYQGDGYDFPESMACPVVMRADQFRELMAAQPAPERQVARKLVAWMTEGGRVINAETRERVLANAELGGEYVCAAKGAEKYCIPLYHTAVPVGVPAITQDQIQRHQIAACNCPPASMVILVSSLQRFLAAAPSAPQGTQQGEGSTPEGMAEILWTNRGGISTHTERK